MAHAVACPSGCIHLLSIASEMLPFAKTGGLGDVTASLPGALAGHGVETRTLLPGYPAVLSALRNRHAAAQIDSLLGHEATIWEGTADGKKLFVLDIPELYGRPGNPYLGPDGVDWADNGIRFAALARAGASIAQGLIEGYQPDVVMAHDWQAGLVPAYLHYDGTTSVPVVVTIHNLAFQGCFPKENLQQFGLPDHAFQTEGVEYYGTIGFLKSGLQFASWITTVSPSYAQEIQTPEWGMGLDGLLRNRADRLTGILNGIDTAIWNPAEDTAVRFPYHMRDFAGRAPNKRAFQAEFGLKQDPNAFLIGIISRLTTQKGIDLLPEQAERLLDDNSQMIVIGAGDHAIEREMAMLQRRFPDRFACHLGYSESLGHRIQAAADIVLIPSRFEPCGLTQLCACHYGAVPVATRVGGLADTIVDANPAALSGGGATGFLFAPADGPTLSTTVARARKLFRDSPGAWRMLQQNGVAYDVSWDEKARQYVRLFQSLIGRTQSAPVAVNLVDMPDMPTLAREPALSMTRAAPRRRIARRPQLVPALHGAVPR